MRFFFDWLPIILFFVVFKYFDIYYATAAAMISSVILIGLQKILRIKIEKIQLVGLAMIVFFGSLTILFQDEQFIKLKPTVLYLVLALVLLGPQFFKKYLIKNLLEKQISLPNRVWKQLNISWILFFIFLGCLNYYIAQSFSTDFWVEFKLFGMLGITLVFTIVQAFWLSKYKNEK